MLFRWIQQFGGRARHASPLHGILVVMIVLLLVTSPIAAQNRYAGLPQTTSLQGFPQLGYPSALADVKIYAAFDDPASGQFWADTFDKLLPRVRNGEVRVVFVPLFGGTGSVTGGRGAARASICANDQQVFWQYADQLFGWLSQYGADAFTGERLFSGAQTLGVNQGQWGDCFTSDGPDVILNDAQRAASSEGSFTGTPYVLVADSPSLTDSESLNFTIDLVLREANESLATQVAATPEAEATAEEVFTYNPLGGDKVEPPLTIDLPEGWQHAYDTIILTDISGVRPIPFALYTGPVSGGTGTIVLLWGFPNLVRAADAPPGSEVQPDVWTDATRLLRLAIVETGCNVGTDLRRNYSVGGLQAIGTQFAAVGCPMLPDTRGWFAGLRPFNVNFVFYVYTDPIEAMDGGAEAELQAILDTVQFVMPDLSALTPEPTTEPAS
jgi:protein-disulfide isomerase